MSSTWGEHLKLSIFGESHGTAIGVTLDGLPAGQPIDLAEVALQMARRAPGSDPTATTRKEADVPEILSGLLNGLTTGAPLCATIRNTNTRSGDYKNIDAIPRPSHADFTGNIRYNGFEDARGGGHFSGRLTAPLVFAGSICRQILRSYGIAIGAHIQSIAETQDEKFNPVSVSAGALDALSSVSFPLINPTAEAVMRQAVEDARMAGDSVGGVIECAAAGIPAGLGSPVFGGAENKIASILFGIPALRGIEFGTGFAAACMRGSEHNDPFTVQDGKILTKTNHHGGILGGITSGMPLIVRVACKPTPSISREQQSVDLKSRTPATLVIRGRHDPCIVPRAVPVVESAVAVALLEMLIEMRGVNL